MMTPLAAGAEPEPKGRRNAATEEGGNQIMSLLETKGRTLTEVDVPSLGGKGSDGRESPIDNQAPAQKDEVKRKLPLGAMGLWRPDRLLVRLLPRRGMELARVPGQLANVGRRIASR